MSRARAADDEGEDGAAPIGLRHSVTSAYRGHPPPPRHLFRSPDLTAAVDPAAGVATALDSEGRVAAATDLSLPTEPLPHPPSTPPPPSTGSRKREGICHWFHPLRSHRLF
uniref:Uncharacterized protein n=1 Tax=Oryza sativa subsp. japonica TaxID=39947 RepID=Q6ZEY4_ORYSJ|nr:hypothetical protein [Oryza sativa Japonica Group]BAD30319.1 hypothetical protein [Oryza sativa Japonica Group]